MNSKYSGIRPTTRRTCETNVSEDHPALEWPDTTFVPLWAARLWSVSQACATLRKSETCWAPGGGRGGASGWGVVRGGALAPGASRRGGASAGARTQSWACYFLLQARILEWVAFPPPGDLPNPGLLHCRQIFFYCLSHQGRPHILYMEHNNSTHQVFFERQGCAVLF